VAKSPPDGYTLLIAVSTNAINETLYSNLNFDFRNDFVPVAGIARIPFMIVVNPNFPAKSIPELIAHAKANPGKVDMATNGVGTGSHVAAELFMMMSGIKLTHVPYKNNYLTDLMGGQVPLAVSPIAAVVEHIKDGKLRGLGVTTAARAAALPDVPTIGESVPGYVVRPHRPQRNARRDHRQARSGHPRQRQRCDFALAHGAARPRARAHDHGRIRQIHRRRNRQMGEGDQICQHQGELSHAPRATPARRTLLGRQRCAARIATG
jgi:hypothetical protein